MCALVDIHAHLLPGLDDGPETLGDSLTMAHCAAQSGIATIAATPHLRSDFPGVLVDEVAGRCEALRGELDAAGISLDVVSAAETSLLWALEAAEQELSLASYGGLGRDLLIETPGEVSMLEQMLDQVRGRGYRVTLAHPERSSAFKSDPSPLQRLSEIGILLQVNAESLLLPRNSSTRRLAERLCREGLAHVLASDAHRGAEWRPVTLLPAAAAALGQLVGAERAAWMTEAVPRTILEGRPVVEEPPVRPASRGLWQRVRGT